MNEAPTITRPWDGIFYRSAEGIIDVRYSIIDQVPWMEEAYPDKQFVGMVFIGFCGFF